MINRKEKIDFFRNQFAEACNHELRLRDLTKRQLADWLSSIKLPIGSLAMLALGVFLNLNAFYPSSVGFPEEPTSDWVYHYLAGYGACMAIAGMPPILRSVGHMAREFSALVAILIRYMRARQETESARLMIRKIRGQNEQ